MTAPRTVHTRAPAKLNLSLRILSREASGFHTLETVFCRIGLADDVSVSRLDQPGVSLEVEGAELGPPDENLAHRAGTLALATMGNPFGISIALQKRIPVGAGLGGGSSNAAAVLGAVNKLADRPIPTAELLKISAQLGSDVPFFMSGASLAVAWSRGERMFELPPLPEKPILLVAAAQGVSTPDAYGWWDEANPETRPRGPVLLGADVFSSWGNVARAGANDFESIVFGKRPDLRDLFESLTRTGPLLCRMTGSGSAIFAVYRTEGERADAALQIGSRHGDVVETTNG